MSAFVPPQIHIANPCSSSYFQKEFQSHNVCLSRKLPYTKMIGKGQKKQKKTHGKRKNMKKQNSLLTSQHENMKVIDEEVKEQPPTTEMLEEEESSVCKGMENVHAEVGSAQKNSNFCQNRDLLTDKVSDYSQTIYTYLRQKELDSLKPLDNTSLTNHFIRSKIVDWLFKVSNIFRFKIQTPFLAINIVDRLMAQICIPNQELQLITITSLYLAAKYEQVMVPKLCNFLALASDDVAVSKGRVLELQSRIICHLNFDFSYVSPSTFIDLIAYQFHLSQEHKDKALSVCVQLMIQPHFRNWSSSHLSWYALYKGCPQAQLLQQHIRNNEELQLGKVPVEELAEK